MTLLYDLISDDFGIEGNGRWFHSVEHNSLVYDAEKDIFYWNSEDIKGDAYIYLTKVRKLSHTSAKEYIKSGNSSLSFITEIKDGEETIVYPKLVEIFHENLKTEDKSYFYKRTITDETISRFRLGYWNGWYTIPFYQGGLFKQFQLRRDEPKKSIRGYYKNVGPLLFNSDILKITDKIVITEGITSCIVLNQNGIACVSYNSGTVGFLPEWASHFIHQKTIYLLYDNDKAGIKGAIRTAKILGEYKTFIYTFSDFEETGYDANDFFIDGHTKDDLKEILESKMKRTWEC